MKILFYTNSFYPDPIGIAYYNTEWVEHLLKLGHDVEVVTAVPYYPQWKSPGGVSGALAGAGKGRRGSPHAHPGLCAEAADGDRPIPL
jgi:hypothetical protein